MRHTADITIIGAGIVGLATAWQIHRREPGLRIVIFDKEPGIAAHQTGHNSGVIHSGIYYIPGSDKARLCASGAGQLIAFARQEGLAHRICGKLIVATREEEVPRLEDLLDRGRCNGLDGLIRLDPAEAREVEPHVQCLAALFVPQTGVVDYPSVAARLRSRLEGAGVDIHGSSEVTAIRETREDVQVRAGKHGIRSRYLVTAAGLWSDRLARMSGLDPGLRIIPFRGEYYRLTPGAAARVRHLIYPVPDPAFPFLGVHFTRRIDGTVEAGPNAVLAGRREGYRRSDLSLAELAGILAFPGFRTLAARYWRTGLTEQWRSWDKRAYLRTIRAMIPDLDLSDLVRGGSGVRAQAVDSDGRLVDDFRFLDTDRMVHVLNAPSPAATASLAIGDVIAGRVLNRISNTTLVS